MYQVYKFQIVNIENDTTLLNINIDQAMTFSTFRYYLTLIVDGKWIN